jgi:hypothetical protein
MKIKLYDKVRLKTGEIAHIVEIFEPDKLYMADISKSDGEYVTEEIRQIDISSIFVEMEEPLKSAM